MLTIDVKTKAVLNKHEHTPVIRETSFGRMDQTPGYIRGWLTPNYPVPAIRYSVSINTDTVTLWNDTSLERSQYDELFGHRDDVAEVWAAE